MIEAKSPTGRVRSSQVGFHERIAPHLGPHLRYVVAKSAGDVQRAVESID